MPLQTKVATEAVKRRSIARTERYEARRFLWDRSSLARVRKCGRCATGEAVSVKVSRTDAGLRAGFGGVQSCGSVWACPVCSEKINGARQSELAQGLGWWLGEGRAALFGTLTLRHKRRDGLADLLAAIGPAWNRTTSGAGVTWNGSKAKKADREIGDKARFGIRGVTRVVEIKDGANGWHPHVHFIMFLERELSPREVLDLESRLFARWEAALADEGYSVVREVGIDLRPVRDAGDVLAAYFTKGATYATSPGAAAYEVTGSVTKREGKGGCTPFELLRAAQGGDERALARWWEYEAATKGRRQLTWSRGLRELLRLGVELDDQAIVDEDEGGDVVAYITGQDYSRLARDGWLGDVLEAAEIDDGGTVLRRLLRYLSVSCLHSDDVRQE